MVELVLSGVGNSALWPPPTVQWPRTARAYADRVDEEVTTVDGQVGGVKSFRYLVVPDSIGPLTLPPVNYSYYDLAARAYRSAGTGAASLPVAAGGESASSAALPPALLASKSPAVARRVAQVGEDQCQHQQTCRSRENLKVCRPTCRVCEKVPGELMNGARAPASSDSGDSRRRGRAFGRLHRPHRGRRHQ